MSSSYPKAFTYYINRLQNFNRQKIRLQTMANTTFSANQTAVIELPVGLLDLSSFTIHGLAKTNTVGAYLPFAEALIDSIDIQISGVSLTNGFTNYNDLFKILKDYTLEDKRNFRKVLQLEDRTTTAAYAATDATDNAATIPFSIYNFLGFLNSVKIFDSTLTGSVKVFIRWAPNTVVPRHATAAETSPTYTLSEVFASIDVLSIDDGVYYSAIQSRLQSAPLELVYDNFQTNVGSVGAPTQVTRWSTSTDCLTHIIGTFKRSTVLSAPAGNACDLETKQAQYFTRGTLDGTTNIEWSVFKINGINYPTNPAEMKYGEVFNDTAHAMLVAQDSVGSTDSVMSSHTTWAYKYFVHAHSFTYDDGEDSHRLVGLSGRNNQLMGTWELKGTGNNIQPILWLKSKSVLRIGAGRFVEVVF